MLEAPLVKSIILMLTAEDLRTFGYEHPMGADWRGIMDFNPVKLSREKIIEFCEDVDTQAIRDIIPCGTPKQVAQRIKGFCDAGMRVFKLMEYGSMGGLEVQRRLGRKGARGRGRTAHAGRWQMTAHCNRKQPRRAGDAGSRAGRDGTVRLGRRHLARALRAGGRSAQCGGRWMQTVVDRQRTSATGC